MSPINLRDTFQPMPGRRWCRASQAVRSSISSVCRTWWPYSNQPHRSWEAWRMVYQCLSQFLFLIDYLSIIMSFSILNIIRFIPLVITRNKDIENDNHARDTATIAIINTIDRNIDTWKVCFLPPRTDHPRNQKDAISDHGMCICTLYVIMFGSIRSHVRLPRMDVTTLLASHNSWGRVWRWRPNFTQCLGTLVSHQ